MSDELDQETYRELKRLASIRLRYENPGHTLSPTALVNELYLKRCSARSKSETDRRLYLSAAAHEMRQILVDHARAKKAEKRGGSATLLTLSDERDIECEPEVDVLALNEALETLGQKDQSKLQIVEMRYFSGLTLDEIALELGFSVATVKRKWTAARAWLFRELSC